MVGLSRQLVADPYWANKAKDGKVKEIRKCISCLVGCWQESLMVKRECRCTINPAMGDERFISLPKARKSLRVAVVGGGPGGLEAARIATLRGHEVTVFEKTGELGGAILLCCTVPGKTKMRWYADWLREQIVQLGVSVRLRTEPTLEELRTFDVVLIATGSRVFRPDIPGIDLPFVVPFVEILRCKARGCAYYPGDRPTPFECGETVLIWGDHFGAADTAEKLGFEGKKVYIVTENREFASWMEPIHRDVMMKRFAGGNGEALTLRPYRYPVTLLTQTTVLEIRKDGEVVLQDSEFRKKVVKVDNVVLAKVVPNDALYEALLEAGITVTKIGDAREVRNLRGAVTDGANIGLLLEEDVMLNGNLALVASLPTEVIGKR
ncbi:MAG: FAD-dependent oxidoreductase, partial [Candidatus Caldatribacterium sp.]|nr:FAD-dependent oxidoreductase [Candidatus Caldatribacterium sp.]